jgi:beta-galactosidase
MKQFGVNHIRTSHNPYSREFIELCDQYGILVVDELYDKWTRQHTGGRVPFEQLWQHDVPEWVKRDRNSPSVVMWSLGNELQQDANMPFNDFGVTMYRLMHPLVCRYDSTRSVTVAMHPRYRNWTTDSLPCELAKVTDIQAYNYRYMYFPGDGRRFPWMTFYQSEASVAAMGQNYFEMELDKVIGLAYWGAIDYLGESQGWPAKGWSQGVFDIALNPKPKAYYMKSFFLPDEPVVHIGVIDRRGSQPWNGIQTGNDSMSDHWNRTPGQRVALITYTNADEVELVQDGKSLGVRQNDVANPKERNQIRWNNITFSPGYLEAIARKNGKVVARHRIETAGTPKGLVAQADNAAWKANGMDLQHVEISLVDNKGRRIPTANDKLTFHVDGDARIVGVINGDINSEELTVGNTRRLYDGKCVVILRSGHKPSPVILTVTAEKQKGIKVKLQTK